MEDKQVLKGGLIFLAFLTVLFAGWRVVSYRPTPSSDTVEVRNPNGTASYYSAKELQDSHSELVKNLRTQELMQNPISEESEDISSSSIVSSSPTPIVQGKMRTPATSAHFSSTNSSPQTVYSAHSPVVSTTGSLASIGETSSPILTDKMTKPGVYPLTKEEKIMKEREERMLAPYLIPDKETQKKINDNLQNLSAAIAQAVQKALTPKSKKEANIEKYLNKSSTGTTAATTSISNPFQTMMAQINTQKQDIIQNVAKAYGKEAGQRAGHLMDQFQGDLQQAISQPDQTPQTIAKNVQKIADNYQRKLNKMNQQNQYDKYVSDLTDNYHNQVAQLQKLYPDNDALNQEFSRITEEALAKELALPSSELTPEEYAKQQYAIQYNMRQQLEEATKKAGASTTGLHTYDNDRAKEILENLQQQEEAGNIISVARKVSESDAAGLSDTLLKEGSDMLAQVEQVYGAEEAAAFKPILDNYYQQMMATTQEELTPAQRQQKQMQLRLDSNRQMLEMQRNAILRMNIPQEQKEQALQSIEQELNSLPKM